MNKQSLNKLSLFLTGMEQRLIDNWEFFKGITAVSSPEPGNFLQKCGRTEINLK